MYRHFKLQYDKTNTDWQATGRDLSTVGSPLRSAEPSTVQAVKTVHLYGLFHLSTKLYFTQKTWIFFFRFSSQWTRIPDERVQDKQGFSVGLLKTVLYTLKSRQTRLEDQHAYKMTKNKYNLMLETRPQPVWEEVLLLSFLQVYIRRSEDVAREELEDINDRHASK